MLLDVKGIINTPGGRMDLRFEQDLSDVDFGGVCPAVRPVLVVGQVRNIAGMLRLQLEADTTLSCVCDRCAATFDKPFHLSLEYLLAEELEAPLRAHGADAVEPFKIAPGPETRREDIGQNKGIHQLGEDEYLHV